MIIKKLKPLIFTQDQDLDSYFNFYEISPKAHFVKDIIYFDTQNQKLSL